MGVQLAAQGLLGAALATEQEAPLAAAASRVLGASGSRLILAGTLVSALGYDSANMLSAPRMFFAFARRGFLPYRFSAVHHRYHTPHVAIMTHAALAWLFAITGTFRALAVLSVVPTMLVLLGCCLAVLVLRHRNYLEDGVPFLVPGGGMVAMAAVGFVVWLLSSADIREVLVVGAILVFASGVYVARLGNLHSEFRRSETMSATLSAAERDRQRRGSDPSAIDFLD